MKRICVILSWLFAVTAASPSIARDAAIEAQEGDIDHWIEYYQKERGEHYEKQNEPSATGEEQTAPPAQPAARVTDDKSPASPSSRK